jgi:Electron transfer DM13
MAETRLPPSSPTGVESERAAVGRSLPVRLVGRITTPEWILGGLVAALMLVLVVIEPDILEAPVENWRTIVFTVGGTVAAAVALVVMLWLKVPAVVRIAVLWVPFAIVSWWLISPYFRDEVVDEDFSTSIATQLDDGEAPGTPDPTPAPPAAPSPDPDESGATVDGGVPQEPAPPPAVPVLLGAGQFVGLAGHSGTGDAGIFRNPDGSYVVRFENFDIENGPDLEVYLVPGADQTSLAAGSIHLGALKGNVGDQTYDLPVATELAPGPYTALVWCEAFSVEFVGATVTVA